MSVKRRLAAAGMPAAGVTVFAALALTGYPASAAPVDSSVSSIAVAGLTPTATCEPSARVKCGYGEDYGSDVSDGGSANGPDDGTDNDGSDSGSGDGVAADDDRGNDGYGGVSPSTSPTATPTATTASPEPSSTGPGGGTDEVPPGGEAPETVSPTGSAPRGNVDELPLTGPPVATITTIGALLAAAGAAIMVGLRRRRNV